MNLGRGKIAVWKGYDGTPHAVSASCTHKGCIVTWNNAVAGRIRRALRLWFIIVSPKTADLPILRCYCTKARLQSEADALAEAKSRVDRVLALNWFAAGKRRYRNHKNLNEAPDRSEPAERASRKVSSHQLHHSLRSTFRSPQRVTPSFSRNTSITFLTASGSAVEYLSIFLTQALGTCRRSLHVAVLFAVAANAQFKGSTVQSSLAAPPFSRLSSTAPVRKPTIAECGFCWFRNSWECRRLA